MEIIALTGPYDFEVKKMLYQMLPSGFEIREVGSENEYGQLQAVDYVILRTLKMNDQVIHSIPNLKLIQRWGVGYDTVDIIAAGKRNIPVAITSGMNAAPVSEMAVLLMLAVYRNLPLLYANVLAGSWRDGINVGSLFTIEGKTVGLVGLGAIGRQVVAKVKAFGATVQYYDAIRLSTEDETKLGIRYVGLEELFRTSDIISLHVPLLDNTRQMIRKETLELMKPAAVIINTARGEIIKEDDLVDALINKRILGAGLDVVEREPADRNNPLLSLQNVVVTPHMGGSTMDISVNMAKRCIENIVRISKGEPLIPTDLVNKQYLCKG
ncbi:2-hydroxyacid dehydrogenase [Anaerospora hongkongensis]|uniref:2-hydroxyacid dehydrogenase n=1 Tax=Anaerospora hongkongensis TaxID=244830 RepID=UPI00289843AF|nr:2-hydroxyacid dehydrogenase [Anaerospora hongkongensis]